MSSNSDFGRQQKEKVQEIEEILQTFLPAEEGYQKGIMEAMNYSLMAGGKRLRPMLMQETHRLFGGDSPALAPFMAAMEMIHTYSLIHDDLPCMDNDDMRRGKPSCHKAFGEATALLAGDALLTQAFSSAAETKNVPAERIVKAIAVLSEKAGLEGMIGGQVMDLAFENVCPETSELIDMYAKKTSCLLEASAMCGCILAGADREHINAAEKYAEKLGLAFQIRDDILDCTADENMLGKPVGSDEKNGKTTFVTLYGLENAQREAEQLSAEALQQLEVFGEEAEMLKELTEYLLDRKY